MSQSTSAQKDGIKTFEDLDIGALAVRTVTSVVKRRPVTVSLWVLGLLMAAFAKGFAVDDATQENYILTLSQAEEVDKQELGKALSHLSQAQDRYYNAKGWFWSCDDRCQKAHDKVQMAEQNVQRIQKKRDEIMTEARREVGIWSVFGVKDVRASFWRAWQSGKDFAKRMTMYDAFFMMMPGGREETLMQMVMKIVMQYVINLTMGLIGAFFFFIYNVYVLIVSYGEPMLSGVAFFLLVLVAGIATVGTYLFAIYGTIAGGGLYLIKTAAKQAAVEGEAGGRRPRRVQYNQAGFGSGRVGGGRAHFE